MAINDLFLATLQQRWNLGGELIHNMFFYRAVDANGTAQALHAALGNPAGILGAVNAIQTDVVHNSSIKVINLFSLTDFYEETINGTGVYNAEALPPFCAVNYSLKLNTRGVRPGSKRFSGIPETVTNVGVINNATYIGLINDLGSLLAENIVGGDDDAEFEPVVVKRISELIEGEGDVPDKVRYRLPADVDEADWGKVTSTLVNLLVSHQVSRGNGR